MGQHQAAQPKAGLTWVFGHLSFWCFPQIPSSRTHPGAPTRRAETPGTPCPSCGSTGSACSPWTSLRRATVSAGAGSERKGRQNKQHKNKKSEQGLPRTSGRWEASLSIQSPSQAACHLLGSQQHDWEGLQRKSKLGAASRYQNVSITLLYGLCGEHRKNTTLKSATMHSPKPRKLLKAS